MAVRHTVALSSIGADATSRFDFAVDGEQSVAAEKGWTTLRWPWQPATAAEDGSGGGVQFLNVLQGVGLAFVTALVLALGLGLATAWTEAWHASDGLLQVLNLVVIAAGGFYGGRTTRRLGWLHGGLIGIVYVLLVSWMLAPEFGWTALVSWPWLREALFAFLAGAVGGIVGVAS